MSLNLKLFVALLATSRVCLPLEPRSDMAGTTGGEGSTAAVPSSTDELISWLGDDTARVIVIDKTFDFTSTEGTVTGDGCIPWTCTPGAQIAINLNSWCDNDQPNAATTTVTYNKAGISGISVGSNKTLLGKGTAGWIKGKGLRIAGSSNIIIQNVRFSDINAEYVWGGDAIAIDGGKNIWAMFTDLSTIASDPLSVQRRWPTISCNWLWAAEGVTISDNVFDGNGDYSPLCDGHHYWTLYFTGASDTITFARNYLYQTSGRGPKLGGVSSYSQTVHIYNNYFVDITDHALDAGPGSKAIVEGNYFNTVVRPSTDGNTGQVFAPIDTTTSAQCTSALGRSCVANIMLSSGELANAEDTSIIGSFTSSAVTAATVMTASEAASYVQSNAGTGVVN
ncbi:Pectate lyase [Rhizoctonia solani]|uniref:pectin lyase n=1 Tax=Rhizoctonia solani TaxID=456999 RepID=A0A8H7M1I8_9AGAM|nr:Pectate lyase [Rhizoctonia solani]